LSNGNSIVNHYAEFVALYLKITSRFTSKFQSTECIYKTTVTLIADISWLVAVVFVRWYRKVWWRWHWRSMQ